MRRSDYLDTRRRYTDAAVAEMRRLYGEGSTIPILRDRFGGTARTVSSALTGRTYGHVGGAVAIRSRRESALIRTRRENPALSERRSISRARRLYRDGLCVAEVARRIGVSWRSARSMVDGVDPVRVRMRFLKLTPGRIRRILSDRAAGDSLGVIGRRYNVDPSTVSRVCAGKYAHGACRSVADGA